MSDLPKGWGTAKLSDLISARGLFSDGDWIESKDQDPNGDIRLLQLADIGDGKFIDKSNRYVNEATFQRLRCTEVIPGDVLIARMPDPLGRACLAPESPQKRITVVDVAVVRPGPGSVESAWLMHTINAPQVREIIATESTGTTRRRIARGKLAQLSLPVPPLEEQKKIKRKVSSLLEQVDACRDRLNKVPQILKKFREAVLEAAVSGRLTEEWRRTNEIAGKDEFHSFEGVEGDAFRGYQFPACWGRSRLSEIAEIAGGITKDSKKQELAGEELPYLRVANVQRGYLNLTEMKTIRVPRERVDSLLLRPGDMLFNEGGDLDKLGRGWVWEGQIERCVFQNHVFRARLGDNHFEPRFFSHFANSRGFDYFLARGKQTTNLASINKSVLSSLPVPVPSADEQVEIMRRINRLFGFADVLDRRYRDAVAGVEKLTPTVLAKAFRGELVPQDPNDEPAGTMLEGMERERKEIPMVAKKRTPARRNRKAGIREAPDVMVANATSTAPTDPEYENATGKLFSVLTNAGGWITAEQAFRECGIANGSNTLEIESLYARLKEMDAAGELLIEAVRDKRGQKIGDRIRLK